MKKRVVSIVVLVSLLYLPVSIAFTIVDGVAEADAPDRTGWNASLPLHWTMGVNQEVVDQLKRGNENSFVTSCHPLLAEIPFAQGRRVYGEDLCRGTRFHVLSVTDDGRWTRGFIENGGGKIWFLPTSHLTPFIYEVPKGKEEKGCSGLPRNVTVNAVPGINNLVKMPEKSDKFDAQLKVEGWLLGDTSFTYGSRHCLRLLSKDSWLTVRYTLDNPATREPVWAYVRLEDGTEGLIETFRLVLPETDPKPSSVSVSVSVAGAKKTGSAVSQYTVQSGDNLSKIAKKFGTSTDALVKVNGIRNPRLVRTGAVLIIPAT